MKTLDRLEKIHWIPQRAGLAATLLASISAVTAAGQISGATIGTPTVQNGSIVINWNSAGVLQIAPEAMGPWQTSTGQVRRSSTATEPILGGSRFFRVVDNGVAGPAIPIFPATPDDPLQIERATIQKLNTATDDGNALLEMRLRQDQRFDSRMLPLLLDDRLVFFRDDGKAPDRQAGDRIFSAIIDAEVDELEEMNKRAGELTQAQRAQPVFDRRSISGSKTVEFFNISNFNAGVAVQVHPFSFGAASPGASPTAGLIAGPPPPAAKTLMITDLSVVEDPLRTWDPCNPAAGTPMGAWTFGKLMTDMANTPVTGIPASDFVRRWLRTWQFPQTINSDVVADRDAAIKAQIINAWEAASGGPGAPLNLAKAPFRLCAIVNRVDLRGNMTYGGSTNNPCDPQCNSGEARFVFSAVNGCSPVRFLVILEYCVPRHGCKEIKAWGKQWAALAGIPFGPAYNTALQAITDQFATANADPSRLPNKSAINQVRSNEILDFPWDMREWRIFASDSDAGWLRQVTVKQTPDFDLNLLPIIAAYCNDPANIPLILSETHKVPLNYLAAPFLGGSAPMPTPGFFWDGPPPAGTSIFTPNARHKFSLNTCNGCHAGETGAFFTHVSERPSGIPSNLSGFLTGIAVPDPAVGAPVRAFNDLARREIDLDQLIHQPCFFHIFFSPMKGVH